MLAVCRRAFEGKTAGRGRNPATGTFWLNSPESSLTVLEQRAVIVLHSWQRKVDPKESWL
jgi:hypothetical protein